MGGGTLKGDEKLQHATAAGRAFDKIDEDGNGYVTIDELQGLLSGLGVVLAPQELDEVLEALDEEDDGVLDRNHWVRWWVKRSLEGLPMLDKQLDDDVGSFSRDHNETRREHGVDSSRQVREEEHGLRKGMEASSVRELAALAQQGRRRAGTDIHTAAWRGDLALVKDFLAHDSALANAVDDSEFGTGYRPMHYAAYGGFLKVCEALHERGARALVAGENGVTALFLAAQAGKSDVVRFLLDLGADPTACEMESGLCAADVAQLYPDILEQMRQKRGFEVPSAPRTSLSVTRVEESSIQVAFSAVPVESGQLPIARYKCKIERVEQEEQEEREEQEEKEEQEEQEEPEERSSPSFTGAPAAATSFATVDDVFEGGPSSVNPNQNATSSKSTKQNITTKQQAAAKTIGTAVEETSEKLPTKDFPTKAQAQEGQLKREKHMKKSGFPSKRGEQCSRSLVELVLVPAGGGRAKRRDNGEERRIVTFRGLKPSTHYRVQVAAVNAMGFGPYGPESPVICTLPEGTQTGTATKNIGGKGKDDASVASGLNKGRGRQVLAREKRRRIAEETRQWREKQQQEAEEINARRVHTLNASGTLVGRQQRQAGPSIDGAATSILTRRRTRGMMQVGEPNASARRYKTQPLLLQPYDCSGNNNNFNNKEEHVDDDDLTESTYNDDDNNNKRFPRRRNYIAASTSAITNNNIDDSNGTETKQLTSTQKLTRCKQKRQSQRPATATGDWDGRTDRDCIDGIISGGRGGSVYPQSTRSLSATAPPGQVATINKARRPAAHHRAMRGSAEGINGRSGSHNSGGRVEMGGGEGKGNRGRTRSRKKKSKEDEGLSLSSLLSDVELSSCGDMTISSAEEGEDMAYAG